MNRRSLPAILMTAILGGCVSVGHQVPPEKAARIVLGKTSKAETEAWLGTAASSVTKNGKEVWFYDYSHPLKFGNHTESFNIVFDTNGLAEHMLAYQRDYKLDDPSTYANRVSSMKKLDEILPTIVRQKTTLDDLVAIFGQPQYETVNFDGVIEYGWRIIDSGYSFNHKMEAIVTVVCDGKGRVADLNVNRTLIK